MKFIQMSLVASTIVLFTACGSVEDIVNSFDPGDDEYVSPTFTGQFVDTYVKGLNYTCTGYVDGEDNQLTGQGVTNAEGQFTCNEGDIVEFSLGSYVIASRYAFGNTIVTPRDLGLSESAVTDLAQLLQTLDDKSTDGALTIPDNFTALNDIPVKLGDDGFDTDIAEILGVPSLVSEEDALAHLNETISELTGVTTTPDTPTTDADLSALLAGKTVYVPYFDVNAVAIWEFSADGTELTWTEDVTSTESISFNGNTITVNNTDNTITTIEATNIAPNVIYITFTDGSNVEYLSMYFDKADADAALLP